MIITLLLSLVLGQGPTIEVTTLAGEALTGRLTSLSATTLELERDGRNTTLPATELLAWRVATAADAVAATTAPSEIAAATETPVLVDFHDGTRLHGELPTASADRLNLNHATLGALPLDRARIRSVRFAPEDPAVRAAWAELVQREKKQDYLVVRKGDVLDHLDGVIGALDEATLKFRFDGDEIDVKRPRIFGWIYAAPAPTKTPASLKLELADGDTLSVTSVAWTADRWEAVLAGSTTAVSIPPAGLRGVDYSAGRVLYLSAIEPRDVEHVPYFGVGGDWPYGRDRNLFGRPIKVGTRTFAKGLALHSKTRLIYRLGGNYRRLTAVAGLDPDLAPNPEPAINNARLTIRGDKRVLFDADVRAGEPPIPLDLAVAGVLELEILVDYGAGKLDIGDRVHLGDLKVLK